MFVYEKVIGEVNDDVDDDGDGSEFEFVKMVCEWLSDEEE